MYRALLQFYTKLFSIVSIIAGISLFLIDSILGGTIEIPEMPWVALALIGAGIAALFGFSSIEISRLIKVCLVLIATAIFAVIFAYYLYNWSLFMASIGAGISVVIIWLVLLYPFFQCSIYIWKNLKSGDEQHEIKS